VRSASTFVAACIVALVSVGAAAAQTVCPEIYRPVCGLKDGHRTTYTNECFATKAGATIVGEGICTKDFKPKVCSQIWLPVCASVDGKDKTFSNKCWAEMAGAKILHPGECRP